MASHSGVGSSSAASALFCFCLFCSGGSANTRDCLRISFGNDLEKSLKKAVDKVTGEQEMEDDDDE